MSSYLNIYIPVHDRNVTIGCWSRNSEIYQAFNENGARYGKDNAVEINKIIDQIYYDEKSEISKTQERIDTLEKNCNGNLEVIEEILNWKEYLKDHENVINYINFLKDVVSNLNGEYISHENKYKLMCYID